MKRATKIACLKLDLIINFSCLRTCHRLEFLRHCGGGGAAAAAAVRIFPPSPPFARKILVRVDWR